MDGVIKAILEMPLANLFVVAGFVFLFISVVGDISGKITPGKTGRIASGVLGVILLGMGFNMYITAQKTINVSEANDSQLKKPSQVDNAPNIEAQEKNLQKPRTNNIPELHHVTTYFVCNLNPNGDNFLSLREGPDSSYPEILRMGQNSPLAILGEKDSWYRVQLNNGTEGWAFKRWICRSR